MIDELHKAIEDLRNEERAKILQRFFKKGKGEYAEGDVFYGLTVPQSRSLVKKYKEMPLKEVAKLLTSKIHEERMIALLIMVEKFRKADDKIREKICRFYLANTKHINNWDLVDLSSIKIAGEYLVNAKGPTVQGAGVLRKLAKSDNLWERRIAIIATGAYILRNNSRPTLEISEILLHDKHDLIHKAVGWMLREVGKRCSVVEEKKFLDKYAAVMPRTMLRYAIEKFSPEERNFYLNLKNKSKV